MSIKDNLNLPTILLMVFIATLVIFATISRYKIAFQTDYSVDFQVGILDEKDKDIKKGELFGFYFLAVKNDDRYGWRFVKRLACSEGDFLESRGRDFYCNGRYIGTAKTKDKKGKPINLLFQYKGRIGKGDYFAIGDTKDSYDSKYWGFVKKEWIIGKVTPLW